MKNNGKNGNGVSARFFREVSAAWNKEHGYKKFKSGNGCISPKCLAVWMVSRTADCGRIKELECKKCCNIYEEFVDGTRLWAEADKMIFQSIS